MVTDTRRTGIFARLSKSGGAFAVHTISFPSKSSWNDPFDALSKEQNNEAHSCALHSAMVPQIDFTWNPLFLLPASCIASTTYNTRLHRRALNLRRDPGSVRDVASMITSDAKLRTRFDSIPHFPQQGLIEDATRLFFLYREGKCAHRCLQTYSHTSSISQYQT